MHLNELTPLGT